MSKAKEPVEHPKIERFHYLMGLKLNLSEEQKSNLVLRFKDILRTVYTKDFTIAESSKSFLLLDGNQVEPLLNALDLKDVFTEALTKFEGEDHIEFCRSTNTELSTEQKEALMERLHHSLYRQYKRYFTEHDVKKESLIMCLGKPVTPRKGNRVNLNEFSNDVLKSFI